MKRKNLIEQTLKTIRHYEMLKPNDRILVAVSGGPDSVFLLHALSRLKDKLRLGEIAVCNLDHGIRGSESREDSLFVEELSRRLKLRYLHKRIDLKTSRPKGLSTEEAARDERYAFFAEAAAEIGANVIATGHTLDDQAETIVMRLVKGASLKGIVGISPSRETDGLRIVRPLLEIEKGDIKKYLESNGIPFRVDRTNLEPIYFRNVVRQDIIPFLERYNPRLKRALFNLAEHLREDFEFIREEKARVRCGMGSGTKGRVSVKLKDLAVQPRALQKEILRDMLERAGGEVKKLTFRHWKELENFIKYKRKGNSMDLPGGVRIERTEDALILFLLKS